MVDDGLYKHYKFDKIIHSFVMRAVLSTNNLYFSYMNCRIKFLIRKLISKITSHLVTSFGRPLFWQKFSHSVSVPLLRLLADIQVTNTHRQLSRLALRTSLPTTSQASVRLLKRYSLEHRFGYWHFSKHHLKLTNPKQEKCWRNVVPPLNSQHHL